ncbi:ABC transporter ATP-binding protein [Paraconexibacter algicola]|uniref:ABC transporter ATP-binding protein n=1 Tax=Paraconexibacter algicola TaxID=2133960 RepID=A0A2T4UIA3_9ACTN|nr:ATP-binding cassette domain-containing protein [Paraconexibacter algicola]PTL58971.1 ABC transporter ATP-binding protein [Paraconexibacter algicola]
MLELRELRKAFGDRVALDGLSLTLEAGQLLGFVGANGAGKTTTMRIALGVLEPDAGDVLWDGRPATPADRASFGYLPEERGLYTRMRARAQLVHFARLHGRDAATAADAADAVLDRVGLADRADDRVEDLSLGNQQRVQLAAALVHDPACLILDEPFSGLDPVGVDLMSEVLRERAEAGVPVLFSSHQLELVEKLCDAVAIVSGGQVVTIGEVAGLPARYRELVRA